MSCVTSSPTLATPASAVSTQSTSRGPRVSARCPSGTWPSIPATAPTDSARPTWVAGMPTAWVKYSANVVIIAPLPAVLTSVATRQGAQVRVDRDAAPGEPAGSGVLDDGHAGTLQTISTSR